MPSIRDANTPPTFDDITILVAELDQSVATLIKGRVPHFTSIHLRIPPSDPAIHAFYTTVSWLYVCIVEAAPVHFKFLAERASALQVDTSEIGRAHV